MISKQGVNQWILQMAEWRERELWEWLTIPFWRLEKYGV